MPSSYILANDLRVHYLTWNRPGDGRAVVLLHGLASNARIWEQVAGQLASRGFYPLAPDLRGHGFTDQADGDYSFDTFLRDLSAFVDTCGLDRPVLVGHSFGAMVALDYAARQSFGPRAAAGVVLVDGATHQLDDVPAGFPAMGPEEIRRRLTPPRLDGMPLDDFLSRLQSHHHKWVLDDQAVSAYLANFEIRGGDPLTGMPANNGGEDIERIYPRLTFDRHMQIVSAMQAFPTYARYERLRCPALLVPAQLPEPWDEDEQRWMALKEQGVSRIVAANPLIQTTWMADTVHDSPLQRPSQLAGMIAGFAESLPDSGRS